MHCNSLSGSELRMQMIWLHSEQPYVIGQQHAAWPSVPFIIGSTVNMDWLAPVGANNTQHWKACLNGRQAGQNECSGYRGNHRCFGQAHKKWRKPQGGSTSDTCGGFWEDRRGTAVM